MPRLLVHLFLAAITSAAAAMPASAQSVRAEIDNAIAEYLAAHPEQVQAIVRDYLAKNPDVLAESFAALIKRRAQPGAGAPTAQGAPDRTSAIRENASLILNSPRQVVLGNPNGNVTMVEFFDYNCGFCKRALGDMQAMIKDDPDLRVVLKELPILGPGSIEAAKIATAVRMQDATGEKYAAFHQSLLGARGQANQATALAAAKDVGLDMARLERDLNSDEIGIALAESTQLALKLGIDGTPGYVIGDAIIPGAIGAAGLKERVQTARSSDRGDPGTVIVR